MAIAGLLLSVTACEPTPDERMVSARLYVEQSNYPAAVIELRNVLQAQSDNTEARLLLGHSAFQLADFGTSENQYSRVLALGQNDAEVWFGLGRALLATGKTVEAMERVAPDLEAVADTDLQFVLLGDIYMRLGNIASARKHYEQAIALNADSAEGRVGLAAIAATSGDLEQAFSIVDASLRSAPDSYVLWRAKGNLLQVAQKFTESANAYAKSIQLETPETPRADRYSTRANRTSSLIDARMFEDAEAQLKQLRAQHPRHPSLSFLSGRIAFGRGDFATAQSEFQTYVSNAPDDPQGQAMLGVVNFRQDNLGQAEMWLTRAVRAQAGGDAIRRLLGETKLRLNKPQEALEALRAAESAGQSDALLLSLMGRAEAGVGDIAAAISYFEQSFKADPSNPATGIALAASYIQSGRIDEGTELLASLPDNEDNRFYKDSLLLGAYLRSEQTESAVAEGERILRENPDDAMAWALVGMMWQTLGEQGKARAHFDKVVELDPLSVAGNFSLGRLDVVDDEFESALQRFSAVLDVSPSFIPALTAYVIMAQQTGLPADVEGRLQTAIQTTPKAFAPWNLLIRHALAEKRLDDAQTRVDDLATQLPDDPRVDHLRGVVLVSAGRSRDAVRHLSRATQASPQNPEYQFDLSNAHLLNRNFEGALANADLFHALRPDDVRGLTILANSAIGTGEPQRALRLLQQFLQKFPDNSVALLLMGDLQLAARDLSAAIAHYERAAGIDWSRDVAIKLSYANQLAATGKASHAVQRWLDENPDDVAARHAYAQMLEADGRIEFAIAQYEKLLNDGTANAIALNNLAWRYSVAGRSGALELARRAHEMAPDNGEIADTLGWILLGEGQDAEAVEVLRQAVSQSGDNPEILYHLAEALARTGQRADAKQIVDRILKSSDSFPSRSEAQRLAASL